MYQSNVYKHRHVWLYKPYVDWVRGNQYSCYVKRVSVLLYNYSKACTPKHYCIMCLTEKRSKWTAVVRVSPISLDSFFQLDDCRSSVLTFTRYWGPVYTTQDRFENVAFFLQLGLPSKLIRTENKTLFQPEEIQTAGFGKNILKTQLLETDNTTIIIWVWVFLKHKSKTGCWLVRFQISSG